MSWIFNNTVSESFYSDIFSSKKRRRERNREHSNGLQDQEKKEESENLPQYDDYQDFDLYRFITGDLGERLLNYFTHYEYPSK